MQVYTNIDFDNRVNDLIKWIGKCENKQFISGVIENNFKYGLITNNERKFLRQHYGLCV